MADVFVSYSRRDSEFVRRLAESIGERGKEAWVDTEGIADAEVFPEAIKRAIESSDAFLFVITPSSVKSAYCENEVEHAREMQKRIVPVLREPVADSELPVEIRDRSWIPFTDDAGFGPSVERLVNALDTDLEAARAHTRWLVKAVEWDAEARETSLLLRGSELKAAEAWLAASPEDADPAPTPLQREYLLASRTASARRQRYLVGASLSVAVVSIGLLIFALISRGQAVSERVSARSQALAAESQAELSNDPEISLILGMRAVQEKATPRSMFALRAGIDASPLELALPTVTDLSGCGDDARIVAVYSPDGRQIAESTCGGLVILRDARTGRLIREQRVGTLTAALAYSPTGRTLAVGTSKGVTLLDAQTGAVSARLAGTPPVTFGVAFSPNGRLLATSDPSGITLWTIPGLRRRKLPRPGGDLSLVFSPDGRRLFSGGYDAAVHVYDVATGRQREIRAEADLGGQSWGEVVAISPDGRQLAVGYPTLQGGAGTVSIYNAKTLTKEFDLMTLPEVEISGLAFSSDGARVAIGAEDGTAGVWSMATRERLVAYDGPTAGVSSMAFTPGAQSVLSSSNDGIVRVWRGLGSEQSYLPISGQVNGLAVAPGRLTLLEGMLHHQTLRAFSLPGDQPLPGQVVNLPSAQQAATALSPDGRFVLTSLYGTKPAPVLIWSATLGKVIRTLAPASVGVAQFSRDDGRVVLGETATASGAGKNVVITLADGHAVTLQSVAPCGPGVAPGEFAFSGDGRRVAAASFCGYADVWNTTTGRLVRQVNEGGEASGVDLSPDGSRLLVSSWDSRATIFNVATGRELVNLIGHTRGISASAFSPTGSLVATTSLDNTVRIWDARTGQILRILSFTDNQGPVAFSASGQQLAIGENTPLVNVDDIVRVFDTCPACQNPRALLALARPHVTTSLTTLERTVVDGS